MNVTVFGATGVIGQQIVTELQQNGHTVTAHARNPAKVPPAWGEDVRTVIGEITDQASIDEAITGSDAVISALGPSMDRSAEGLPLVTGTQLIVDAMTAQRVTRYVGNGTPSVHDTRDRIGIKVRAIGWVARTFLPRAYKEMIGMSAVIQSSTLDWTIVRFTAPTNNPKTGRVKAGFFGHNRIGTRITRGDIAAFTAAQVDSVTYTRAAPAISN